MKISQSAKMWIYYRVNNSKKYILTAYIPKIMKDQAEIYRKIIFEGSNAYAKMPLKLNEKHPSYPKSSYLPCLESKITTGDTKSQHVTYLAVFYIRGELAV